MQKLDGARSSGMTNYPVATLLKSQRAEVAPTVPGLLLVVFTFALLTKLPGLVFSGERAIGAEWLLWLVAVIVLFLNAAYRDGLVDCQDVAIRHRRIHRGSD